MDVQVLSEKPAAGDRRPEGWRSVLTHTHTYSGQDDHGGTVRPPQSYERLAEWACHRGIDALGMGSPYTPKAAQTYKRYDGPECSHYYGGGVDPATVSDGDEIADMLAQVNEIGAGRTLFYLDNETPKGRYGHLWWLGYRQKVPAWHDYDQPYDRWMCDRARAGDYGDEPMPYERRPYLEIVAEQRARGVLGFWAHPTSWWTGDNGQFVTNIASEMPAHAIAEGRLDGMVIMGYQPHRPEYQEIWFALLDRGLRVPGVAEMDCGLSDSKLWTRSAPLLTCACIPGQITTDRLTAAFRAGRLFASSGPFIDMTVDGHPMGDVAPTSAGQAHTVEITAFPHPGGGPLDRVELIGRGGAVLWSRDGFPGGTIVLRVPGMAECGYLLARVRSDDSGCADWRQPARVAVGNPIYLHPEGAGFEKPAVTDVEVTILPHSPFAGGELRFEAMNGELLSTAVASAGIYRETLPATARLTLVARDGRRRTDYLLNANQELQSVQRYLYRGRFLRDFPDARSGEVPLAAWQLDKFAEALRAVRLTY